ncbi:hypothetical protein CC86DRAFT_183260 [Ophiobolus disseminans]|uniref:Uncharacterized protein n=1 Tax=Ophiobolus disseminans TaxID=1469910 RepID=A0A6A7A898_9PLEO|nr:hypothetical protein CC86DRAFT_183260 [Ophiobolus disseminans]
MSPKFSWSLLSRLVAIVLQAILLAGLVVLLLAGSGPLKNDIPTYPWGHIALINTGEYTRDINGEPYRGLPDSHDFSKQKDFFAIFPALYCSGWKKDGNYHADYCSPWGRQLFDLHRLWRVWGVDLIENKLVAQAPKKIFIGLVTSAASAGLSLLGGLLAVYSYRCTLLVAVLSWVAMIATLSTASLSHTFATKLVSYASSSKYDGKGGITIDPGRSHNNALWTGVALAITTAAIWTLVAHRHRKDRNAAHRSGPARKKMPFIGSIRRAAGSLGFLNRGSYKHLNDDVKMKGLGGSPNSSHPDVDSLLRTRSRDASPGGEQVLYGRGRVPQGSTAYEPLRHRQMPG